MDLNSVESFVAICDLGSFTSAAELRHLSQPTLSRHVAQLESEFGMRLIDRSGSRVIVTPEGREFLAQARVLLRDRDRLKKRMGNLASGLSRTLVIGFENHITTEGWAIGIERISREMPYVELQFKPLPAGINFGEELSGKSVDAVICIRDDVESTSQISYRVLRHTEYGVFAARSHPLAANDSLKVSDLKGQRVVLWTANGQGERHALAKLAISAGCEMGDFLFVDSDREAFLYACTGRYVTIGSTNIPAALTRSGGVLKAVPFSDVVLRGGDQVLAYLPENQLSRHAADVFIGAMGEGQSSSIGNAHTDHE